MFMGPQFNALAHEYVLCMALGPRIVDLPGSWAHPTPLLGPQLADPTKKSLLKTKGLSLLSQKEVKDILCLNHRTKCNAIW